MAGVLFASAVGFGVTQWIRAGRTGDAAQRIWFYDESERRLYAVPGDTVPPHRGIGGAVDDGVRAVVVVARSERNDARRRRIAYLEKFGAPLKRVLEEVRAARAEGRVYPGRLPARDSSFVETNTLVRAAEGAQWFIAASAEGREIVSRWRDWRGPGGEPLEVLPP